jgi:hypothetical protein
MLVANDLAVRKATQRSFVGSVTGGGFVTYAIVGRLAG